MSASRQTIGVDLGGTDTKFGVVDASGRLTHPTKRPTNADRGADAVIDGIVRAVQELRTNTEAEHGGGSIVAIGIGSPGPLSPSKGVVFHSPNLPGWSNVPFRDRVAEKIGLPTVLDNDANVAAYGEYRANPDFSHDDLVLMTLGTGLGTGAIVNGRIFHGQFENAAEMGHMIVQPGGLHCNCGQQGCLEQYTSAGGLVRRVIRALEAGEASSLTAHWKGDEGLSGAVITQAAQNGDALARRLWDELCQYLAIACVNIQHALNPKRVLIGGGMSAAGDFLITKVRAEFDRIRWRVHTDFPNIELARLGNDAGTIGAGLLAHDSFAESNDATL